VTNTEYWHSIIYIMNLILNTGSFLSFPNLSALLVRVHVAVGIKYQYTMLLVRFFVVAHVAVFKY